MKPEPLKGKAYKKSRGILDFYREEDIKSAVEWLKEELRKVGCNNPVYNKIIDEAFHDVTKVKK